MVATVAVEIGKNKTTAIQKIMKTESMETIRMNQ